MRCAELICIGSQKAATTWLHRMLSRHPRVFMPPMKEVHYFDTLHVEMQQNFQKRRSLRAHRLLGELVEQSPVRRSLTHLVTEVIRHPSARRYVGELRYAAALKGVTFDDAWYASLFAAARPDQVACDFTPAYALLPPAGIAHLRRLSPAARVVYILRDPVERALSHARMLVVRNRAPRTDASLARYLDHPALRSHDDCIATLDRWRAHWPEERFKVLFYDDIQSRPLNVLADVCSFAGLPFEAHRFRDARRVVYRGPAIQPSDETRRRLAVRFAPILAELTRRYPVPAAAWGNVSHRQAAPPLPRIAPLADKRRSA